MDKDEIDPEEHDLLDSYERGEWQPLKNLEGEAQRYREYARATFRKDTRVNIRISSKDLEEGIPYQTLIASVLHKYVSVRLSDCSQ